MRRIRFGRRNLLGPLQAPEYVRRFSTCQLRRVKRSARENFLSPRAVWAGINERCYKHR